MARGGRVTARPDRFEYEEGYADGFDRGEEAIVQQVDGIIENDVRSPLDRIMELRGMISEFWKERKA